MGKKNALKISLLKKWCIFLMSSDREDNIKVDTVALYNVGYILTPWRYNRSFRFGYKGLFFFSSMQKFSKFQVLYNLGLPKKLY